MKRIVISLILAALGLGIALVSLRRNESEPADTALLRQRYTHRLKPSVDHSKFVQLQKRFARPQDVTEACIGCHNGRHKEVMRSSHWNWERAEYIEGRGVRYLGKKNILNNFCIGTAGNHQSCNKCHIGYGWGDAEAFDFNDPSNVDCLACHDNSNTYVKGSGMAGYPDTSVNLSFVAQRVGKPTRTTCGTCHFFGGGGNNVKHGDLEMALFDAPRTVDVHMGTDGVDMQCTDCHTAQQHQMKGKLYSLSSMNRNRVACEDCHGPLPHDNDLLNEHTYKVSCQACHIPVFAKVNKTKMSWDWSTAGKLRDGEPYEVKDSSGYDSYLSIKGSFVWAGNVRPEYVWSNGTASHYLLGDSIEAIPVQMNRLHGDYGDPDAKIIPVKIHRSNQPYDTEERRIIQPKLYGTRKGDGGYWVDFNWETAARDGMADVGQPFSGHVGFVKTEMVWPVNHMVSPSSDAVKCNECHTRENSRLAALRDFYLPGRDFSPPVDFAGTLVIGFSIAGVGAHAIARIIMSRHSRKEGSHA